MSSDSRILLLGGFALTPFLECDPKEATERILCSADHVIADDACHMIDAIRLKQNVLDLFSSQARALKGRGIGQLQCHKDIALVLVGEKTSG